MAFTIVWLAFAFYGFGEMNAVTLFWSKVMGLVSAVALNYYSAKQSYFYFRNAGYRMRRVIITTFLAELLTFIIVFLLVTAITYATRHVKS